MGCVELLCSRKVSQEGFKVGLRAHVDGQPQQNHCVRLIMEYFFSIYVCLCVHMCVCVKAYINLTEML